MTPEIKQCGKVIAYDFVPRRPLDLEAEMVGQILYSDDRVLVARYEFYVSGKLFGSYHFMTDLHTGKVTHL